jgi:RNA polymerase sigma factor (sigma-70 family)
MTASRRGPAPAAGEPARGAADRPTDGDRVADTALVAAVVAGDAAALEDLYSRYGRSCYALARRVVADEQLAQDVVQEVFLALWRDASRFDGTRGGFSTWLLSMTHHKAVDCVRREEGLRRRRTAVEQLEAAEPPVAAPDDEVWSRIRGERVREALGSLPPAQREALVLAYFGGLTADEIARRSGVPLGTAKSRIRLGLAKLRSEVEGRLDVDLTPALAAA